MKSSYIALKFTNYIIICNDRKRSVLLLSCTLFLYDCMYLCTSISHRRNLWLKARSCKLSQGQTEVKVTCDHCTVLYNVTNPVFASFDSLALHVICFCCMHVDGPAAAYCGLQYNHRVRRLLREHSGTNCVCVHTCV